MTERGELLKLFLIERLDIQICLRRTLIRKRSENSIRTLLQRLHLFDQKEGRLTVKLGLLPMSSFS